MKPILMRWRRLDLPGHDEAWIRGEPGSWHHFPRILPDPTAPALVLDYAGLWRADLPSAQ
jgi:hypothetical protein